jgi:peptidoglycan L-alanyl-D-glutamate endopeptidase CwlK
MPKFSNRSREKLETCDPRLQELMNEVIKYLDISIIDGQRSASQQDLLYEKGYSKVQFPNSKHNSSPSMAVDVMLWNKEKPHLRWDDKVQMAYVAGFIKGIAEALGIKIRQGADWNGDVIFNESFFDGPHVELVND